MPNANTDIDIVIDSDGELLIYTKGHISGSYELKKRLQRVAALEREVQLVAPHGQTIKASLDNPADALAICAALVGVNPGRSTILDAPDEVWDFLEAQEEIFGEADNYDTIEGELEISFESEAVSTQE